MKKIFWAVLVLLAGFVVWFVVKQSPTSTPTPTPVTVKNISKPDASNATFIFDDGDITLVKGTNSKVIIPGGELTQDTTLTDTVAYGDLNNDNKNDTAVVLVQSGGGSGVFIYVAAYVSGLVNYKGTNAIFVGDRIEPKSISIVNGVISFKYLDRKANEPMAADPTVLITKQFVYSQGTLSEK
jgi:hypothetical protein